MIVNYIYIAVFASFPEALLILLLGFNLSNFKNYSMSKLLIVAFIQSIIALFIRVLSINFGVHTIIQITSLYVLVLAFFKIKYYKAIISVLIGAFSQGVIQSIVIPIFIYLSGWELNSFYNSFDKTILSSIPIFIISGILLIVIRKKNIFLCDINN